MENMEGTPVYLGAVMRQAAADRAELELERARAVRLENRVRDLNAQVVRAGALEVRANAYRNDLEEEKAANSGLRFEVQILREDLERARATVGVLWAQVSAAEEDNRRLKGAGSG